MASDLEFREIEICNNWRIIFLKVNNLGFEDNDYSIEHVQYMYSLSIFPYNIMLSDDDSNSESDMDIDPSPTITTVTELISSTRKRKTRLRIFF